MGSGTWTTQAYCNYVNTTRGINASSITLDSVNQFYVANSLDPALNPPWRKGERVPR